MRIDLAGFGPGAADLVTPQVQQALSEADIIITSERLAQSLKQGRQAEAGDDRMKGRILVETSSHKILRLLEEQPCASALCLFSGDSSFYSGAAPLLSLIEGSALLRKKGVVVRVLPGISSLSFACARLGLSFREVEVFSAHGRECDPVRAVMNGKKSFFLTGGSRGPAEICQELTRVGLGFLKVTVLEMLSDGQERIREMTAREAANAGYLPLSVLIAEKAPVSEHLRKRVPGIADALFLRGNVPMTKRLVRASALSLLSPVPGDVCWDLGAGTGSVSIELAACCRRVFSVERNPEAVRLMEENRKRFGAWNMEIIEGEIPGVLGSLPLPDRIFVGGGGGQISAVLDLVRERAASPEACRSREARPAASEQTRERAAVPPEPVQDQADAARMPVILASAVTLETLEQVRSSLGAYGYETQIVQLAVTNVRRQGHFHMMDAQNPVFLILGIREGDRREEEA